MVTKIIKTAVFCLLCGAIGYFIGEAVFGSPDSPLYSDFSETKIMNVFCAVFFAVCGVYLAVISYFNE